MQLIVLGMHRSGTSSVTRLLNMAGAYFGPEGSATDPNEENPKGFWERRDVRDVCDSLLFGGGFDWWKVADFSVDRIPDDVQHDAVEQFRHVVFQLDAHRPWVMKEPRLCLVLPILRPVLEVPVFVHVVREPLEIAESVAARNGIPIPVGIALWEAYTIGAVKASAGAPRVLVSYGDLVADPVATVGKLVADLTELGVQGLHVPTDREVTAFVSESLYRQHKPAQERGAYLNGAQASLATACDKGRILGLRRIPALSDGATAMLRGFEAERARADELEEARVAAAASEDEQREVARVRGDEADTVRNEIENLQREADERRRELEARQDELEALTRELDEQRVQHEHALAARQRDVDVHKHDLDAARENEDAMRSRSEQRRDAERRAIESLRGTQQRVRTLSRSRGVKIATKVSAARERVRGNSESSVDVAIKGVLDELQAARSVLETDLNRDRPPAINRGSAEPPTADELRLRRGAARSRGERAKVAVVTWDVGHNPFGRAHLLADLLRDHFEVELWGAQFERYGADIWPPMRDTKIPVTRYAGATFPTFFDTMEKTARWIDADAIYVSKPRLPALGVGILAKESWNRALILDVDDFEPSFFAETEGIDVGQLLAKRGDPDLDLPFGRLWTQACDAVATQVDQITVSNRELQERFGGVLVPHPRDENVFDPERYDRAAERQRLGLRDSDRLILFGGTPRAHKGFIEVLEAVDRLGDDNMRVGAFGTRELEGLRKEIGGLEHWILPLPYVPFDELPKLLVAADLTCALQSPDHPVSRFQMPAKVTDAMAMGVPCIVTPVLPLQPLIDKDVVEVFDGDRPLDERLREIFGDADATRDRACHAREAFLESYSYAAVRPTAVAAIERYLDEPPVMRAPLAELATAVRDLGRRTPATPSTPSRSQAATAAVARRRRRPVPPGSTYDLAVFWRQNDTGIYGRRQDMFLKYLERSGRFDTIVHFDHPMSVDELARMTRRSVSGMDQNRLVMQQTVRRLGHKSDRGAVHYRTFLYSDGRGPRSLGLPHRDKYVDFVRSVFEDVGVGGQEGIGRRPLVFWMYPTSDFLPAVADAFNPDVLVTDVVDDNRTWYAPDTPRYEQLERNYADVLGRSDIVLANCEPVAASMRQFTSRVEVISNVCELPDESPRGDCPPELRGLEGPIIGYAGNLSGRIDLDLLHRLARARRDWNLVFLGSTHLDRSALRLASEPNVRLIGTKRYYHAQSIIRYFDVALIPHIANEMTESMNPLKAYVYCSLGVPIVSTPVANLEELADYITIANGPEEFAAAIEGALAHGRWVPDRDTLLPHSWEEERVERAIKLVDEAAQHRSAESE